MFIRPSISVQSVSLCMLIQCESLCQALDRAEAELCFPFADGAEVVVRSSSRGGPLQKPQTLLSKQAHMLTWFGLNPQPYS